MLRTKAENAVQGRLLSACFAPKTPRAFPIKAAGATMAQNMALNHRFLGRAGTLLFLIGLLLPASSSAQVSDSTKLPASSEGARENPFGGQEAALREGQKIYERHDCHICHGRRGGGGIGPSLRDGRWSYGSTDADLYKSIHDGRPGGMLAFGDKLSEEEIWKLVTFVRLFSQGSSSIE